ncbi:MAG: deoxynucleoside kinase [Bacteroidetes bacterium]|jgi:deoxyadenosine/deoxycytidine kinase|nr:deoxynucleoside kinase [Bacteroidota bacterium]MBX7128025.1 deoxynucleoside kinase [Flavobacteriales bacterium]MCC6654497.1 deoxynucleoside kinase [Flavobacteriales bacterium]HMU14479.1 deoxynucleoside kinase [Flavobacteriales bacterium]HMW96081.1 deoxynucleoside kinase [Flavobacteriales bacterium]
MSVNVPEATHKLGGNSGDDAPVSYGYIAVEGLIGAGKTTLAKRLATRWSGRTVLEEFEDNPFLPRFYEDQHRYAFSVELSFLAQRYHQLKRVGERSLFEPITVADYSIGKSLVFASVTLPPDERALFTDLYTIMYAGLPRPDLLVYLHLPIERVRQRIRLRGRSYEQAIPEVYLERLQETYLDHLQKSTGQRVLALDIGEYDLLHDAEAYERFLNLVDKPRAPGFSVERL